MTKGPRITKGRKPRLRLVAKDGIASPGRGEVLPGGEARQRLPKTRGAILPGLGVTAKEEAFAQAVASGLSQSEAFRRSHDAEGMKSDTVHRQAVRVATRDRVRARIDQLLKEKEGVGLHDRRKALAWALERLQKEAESAETDGARVQAVALIMRHHALLTDRLEAEHTDNRTSAELEAELKERLASLLRKAG